MNDTNFQPLFDYMDEKFGKIESRLDNLESGQKQLQTSVDNLTKVVKDFQDEHIILRRQLEILREWAEKVSEKVGIPLPKI